MTLDFNDLSAREIRQKQLRFRAWRRGFREHDYLMGGFADAHLAALTDAQLEDFSALLDEADWDVHGWVLGQIDVPAAFENEVMAQLQGFAKVAFRQFHRETAASTAK